MNAGSHRLESLDAFRGIAIAMMILVNNPGNWNAVFPPLLHANWNGWTLADVVFPFFIFIMGCAMPFAFARRKQTQSGRLIVHIVRRTAALLALGLVLNAVAAAPHFRTMRFPGVLQRIALAYLFAAVIVLRTNAVGQAAVAAALLGLHWAALALIPFGGWPAGVMTPTHNLAGFIDMRIFAGHTLTTMNDPEGLLGTLSTVATALIGALSGQWIRTTRDETRRTAGLVAGGLVAGAIGVAWSIVLPVNKPLWTGSYTLLMSGMAALALAGLHWLVDVRGARTGVRPFVWLGINPLVIYFLSELVGHLIERPWRQVGPQMFALKDLIYWDVLSPVLGGGGGAWASFAFAVAFVMIWVALAGVLYRRGVRFRLA